MTTDGTILVVDAQPLFARAVARILEAAGRRVECVAGVEAALERIARGSVALVISGLRFPGLNGLDLGRILARAGPGPRLLLLSGAWSPEEHAEATRLTPHLGEKPIGREELLKLVDAALGL